MKVIVSEKVKTRVILQKAVNFGSGLLYVYFYVFSLYFTLEGVSGHMECIRGVSRVLWR